VSPHRIQRKRTKGWRMPEGTVYVGRPTRWGNPWQWPGRPDERSWCASQFRIYIRTRAWTSTGLAATAVKYPTDEEIRAELAGKNLACWCPEGAPCHADILLKIAAGEDV